MLSLLIVDDEPLIRKGIKNLIDLSAFEITQVFEAENGLEALDIVKNQSINLLLVDINMPKMNGLEFVEKAKEYSSDLKIAMITGYDNLDYAISALKSGVDDYVLKPVSKTDIIAILTRLTQKYNQSIQEKEALHIANKFYNDSPLSNIQSKLNQIINKYLADPTFSLQTLAEETSYNTSYLSQLFKKEYGINFRDYLLHLRLEKGKILLLTTNHKIYEISQEIGFDDPNYFSTCFKRIYGYSISEFKEKHERKSINE